MSIEHFHIQSYEYCKGRHAELLKEAETARLARLARKGQRTQSHIYTRALSWLGRRLITWGEMLRERFDTKVDADALAHPPNYAIMANHE